MKYALMSGFVIISIFFALFAGVANADNDLASADITKSGSSEVQMKTIGIIGGISWFSSLEYYRLMNEEGAQGVILGCTEIPLLIKQADVKVPVFDTMETHADAAVKYALNGTY